MPDLKLGLIGCGQVGRIHTQCMQHIDGARFVAYADMNEQAAAALLNDFGGEYSTRSEDKLIADDSIDAIYICTRHDSHASLACQAAKAGKHLFVEKPLALTLEQCLMICEAVKETGVQLMPGFKMRYYPLVQKAHAFIPRPQVVAVQIMDDRWPDNEWIQDPIQGGANVKSQGCHATDLLRYFAGSEPRHLWATGGAMTHIGHPCLDQCVASIEFANGQVGSWIQGDAGMGRFTGKLFAQLFADNRSVQIYDRFTKATFFDGEKSWTVQRPEEEGYQRENQAFIEALRKGRMPPLSVHDGIQAMRMVLAAEQSVQTRAMQTLDADPAATFHHFPNHV